MVDWIIHYVFDNEEKQETSAHTHGLDKHGLLELEWIMNTNSAFIANIINAISIELVNNYENKKVENNYINHDMFNIPFRLDKKQGYGTEGEVYRIVFPDKNDYFPENEKCDPLYKLQII